MLTIPVKSSVWPDGTPYIEPSTPIPADAIATICDGTNYTVYQPGDTLPDPVNG